MKRMTNKPIFNSFSTILKYKRGKFISPFIFIGLLTSILTAQFGLSNWIHPGVVFDEKIIPNSVYIYSNDDIYFISRNDSTKVYNLNSKFGTHLQINQNLDFQIELEHNKNKILLHENLLKMDINEDYLALNSNITFKKNKFIQPSLLFSTHKKYFSFGGACNIYLQDNMFLQGYYSINKKYFNLELSYDNFLYNPDTQEEKKLTHYLGYMYHSDIFSLNINTSKTTYEIMEDINNPTRIKTPYHTDKINSIQLALKNKKQSKFLLVYKNYKKAFAMYFIKNNDPFIKLSNVIYNSQEFNISYKKQLHKSLIEIGYIYRKTDLIIASKIKAFFISPSLESLFGGLYINNHDQGDININSIFINYQRNINKHHLKFHFSHITNYYNINIINDVYSIIIPFFADPELSTNEMINYKKSTSFILGFEDKINFNKIIVSFKFYQTIPLKILKYRVAPGESSGTGGSSEPGGSSEQGDSENQYQLQNNNRYGLGKFYINFAVPIS